MATTITEKFLQRVQKDGPRIAIRYARHRQWFDVTWQDYYHQVLALFLFYQKLNIQRGTRIAILSDTRFEWALVDMANLCAGMVTVPIYQSATTEETEYILKHSEAQIVFCENESLLSKILPHRDQLPDLKEIFLFERSTSQQFIALSELSRMDRPPGTEDERALEESIEKVKPGDNATIVYTSGTTGKPKGVLLTHRQIVSEVMDAFPLLGVTSRDTSLTFMPFAHILGRIEIWGHVVMGYTMAFAESIDRVKQNIVDVRPTLLIAVPRIFEKIYFGIKQQVEISLVKRHTFEWAMGVGREFARLRERKEPIPIPLSLQYQLAKKLVFDKIADKLGGRLRFVVSGGAPLDPELAEFFSAVGILLLEGYGLTETTAAVFVNTPFAYRFGSVGKPIGDVEAKIAADGEILIKSQKVMKEYYLDPETTANSLADGYFKTGDIGHFDKDGFLYITDRKKDLIKTSGGKYVAPQKVEGFLKTNPLISHAVVIGDKKKYIVALIALEPEVLSQWADENGHKNLRYSDLVQLDDVKIVVRTAVAQANEKLASFESVKKFALAPEPFTIDAGEITPSLKVKRKYCSEKYADLIESLYR